MNRFRIAAVLAGSLVYSGCTDLLGLGGCADVIYRAIDVDVYDARTGHWIAAGASGEVQDGGFIEPLAPVGWRGMPPNDTVTTLGAALGRKGTYTVRVGHPGYQPWEQRSVRVRSGACGVETSKLTARLTPVMP